MYSNYCLQCARGMQLKQRPPIQTRGVHAVLPQQSQVVYYNTMHFVEQ